tara:strand:- start:71 stop:367 length:297 start_codon:yes stop_codon:yes gene_type:complete
MEEKKKKGLMDGCDTHEERMEIVSTIVRLGVVVWSGFIITLNYVDVPMLKKSSSAADITFVASIFAGGIASFGLSTSNGKNGNGKGDLKCSECQKIIK